MSSTDDRVARERRFQSQCEEFLDLAAAEYGEGRPRSLAEVRAIEPRPLKPVVINDVRRISDEERARIESSFWGHDGVAYFAVSNPDEASGHFALDLAVQLADALPLGYPVDHPMEMHHEAQRRFGEPDGTLKLYNLEIPDGVDKYREQAETKEEFAAHNDGLGYGGAIATSIIALDSPPFWGGYTCFQNLVRVALALAHDDAEAFRALFLPDAITAIRPRGKGAIRVTSPVLYVNDHGEAQTFFRIASGEYRIQWRSDVDALERARSVLLRLAQPFAPSSSFVHLVHRGEGVILRNSQIVHSRTAFEEGLYGTQRVLARKWFVREAADAAYKHVPGMNIHPRYAEEFPEYFRDELLHGEWNFDDELERNVRHDV